MNFINENSQALYPKEKKTAIGTTAKRVASVPIAVYWTVFKSAKAHYVFLILLTGVTTGIKVFSDWWIGQIKSIKTMSDTSKIDRKSVV